MKTNQLDYIHYFLRAKKIINILDRYSDAIPATKGIANGAKIKENLLKLSDYAKHKSLSKEQKREIREIQNKIRELYIPLDNNTSLEDTLNYIMGNDNKTEKSSQDSKAPTPTKINDKKQRAKNASENIKENKPESNNNKDELIDTNNQVDTTEKKIEEPVNSIVSYDNIELYESSSEKERNEKQKDISFDEIIQVLKSVLSSKEIGQENSKKIENVIQAISIKKNEREEFKEEGDKSQANKIAPKSVKKELPKGDIIKGEQMALSTEGEILFVDRLFKKIQANQAGIQKDMNLLYESFASYKDNYNILLTKYNDLLDEKEKYKAACKEYQDVCIKIYYREFLSRTSSVIKYYLKSIGNFEEVNGTRLFDNLPKNTQQYIIANSIPFAEITDALLNTLNSLHILLHGGTKIKDVNVSKKEAFFIAKSQNFHEEDISKYADLIDKLIPQYVYDLTQNFKKIDISQISMEYSI